MTRREFQRQTLGGLLTFTLLESLAAGNALAGSAKAAFDHWVADLDDLGRSLKGQKIPQVAWQSKVEELFSQVDLSDLLKAIDFERLSANLELPDNGARSLRFEFHKVEGLPTEFVFGRQIFALKKDRSVVPHGHNNMATAFLILNGTLHGRHYDRLEDEKEHLIIRPTIDRSFESGGCSTISDFKDNIHWFKAITEPAFILNIHVMNIRPSGSEATGRVYLDPNGEKLSQGRIRAPRLSYKQAHSLYG